jgi:hypothetical protein
LRSDGLLSGSGVLCRRLALAGGGPLAHDAWLDDQIARAADQDQMLDIVAADEHELAPIVDWHGIDDRQAWQPSAPAAGKPAPGIAPHQPNDHREKQENDDKSDGVLRDERTGLAKDRFQHCTHECASSRPRPGRWSKRNAAPSSRISG